MNKQEFYHIGGALGDADQAGQALERDPEAGDAVVVSWTPGPLEQCHQRL